MADISSINLFKEENVLVQIQVNGEINIITLPSMPIINGTHFHAWTVLYDSPYVNLFNHRIDTSNLCKRLEGTQAKAGNQACTAGSDHIIRCCPVTYELEQPAATGELFASTLGPIWFGQEGVFVYDYIDDNLFAMDWSFYDMRISHLTEGYRRSYASPYPAYIMGSGIDRGPLCFFDEDNQELLCGGHLSFRYGGWQEILRKDGSPLPPLVEMVAGEDHVCAICEDSQIYCWGNNGVGQLGDGKIDNGRLWAEPILINDLQALKITSGVNKSCALFEEDKVYCWGESFGATPQLIEPNLEDYELEWIDIELPE